MLSKKVFVEKSKIGRGLFAGEKIKKGEVILVFEGPVRRLAEFDSLPKTVDNHSVQVGWNSWLEPLDGARFINHSCEPNCGIKGKTKLVAMRNIKKGEELTYDYDMTENSSWKMKCKCGRESCRGVIRGYRNLPEKVKQKYMGYVSDWIRKERKKSADLL